MDPHRPTALLGGLSAAEFMRRHWQRKPLARARRVPWRAGRRRPYAPVRARGPRRRRVAPGRARRRALVGAFRPAREARVAAAGSAGVDAARPGGRSPRRRSASPARALPLHRRRARRRRHVLVCERRRRRRPARRFLRRLPAADVGAQALAHRSRREAAPARRRAAEDAGRIHAEPGVGPRSRRHALSAARVGPRGRRPRPVHHRVDRLSRAGRR